MSDELEYGTYGASAGRGEEDTAFDILREIVRKNPEWKEKQYRLAHWEAIVDDDALIREVHRYWMQNNLRRLRNDDLHEDGEDTTTEQSTEEQATASPSDQPPRKTATKRDYTAGIELHRNLLMNMYRINGKPLADCTGSEVKGAATEHKRHHQFLSRVAEGMDNAAMVRDAYKGRERLIDQMMES
jgi:hypothetical protein